MQIFDLTEHIASHTNWSDWESWMKYSSHSNDNSNVVNIR